MAWYNSSWDYRRKFTSDNTKVEASYPYALILDLSQFPSDFFSKIQSGGEDIRITKADGSTEVARGVREVDTTGEKGLVYFYADGISTSSDTDFYIYYGNSGASDHADDATYGMENVFSSDYKFYSTMADLTTSSIKDETSNDNNGTKKDTDSTEDSGVVGSSQLFNNGYIEIGSGLGTALGSSVTELSVGMWVRPGPNDINESNVGLTEIGYVYDSNGGFLLGPSFDRNGIRIRFNYGSTNLYASPTWQQDTWSFIIISYDGSRAKLYQDGVEIFDESVNETIDFTNPGSETVLGSYYRKDDDSLQLNDTNIDEYFISLSSLTANEAKTIYNNQSSNSTFWTVGSEETEEPIITSTGFMAFM